MLELLVPFKAHPKSLMTTLAPSRAIAIAVALPMPLPLPVTIATFPANKFDNFEILSFFLIFANNLQSLLLQNYALKY